MRCILRLARRLAKRLGEPGDHLRVDRIVLGQPSCRQREAADPLGVNNPHLDARDNEITLCHRPLPSLLGPGSKPLQLFGLRKTPELSLALIQANRFWGVTGSVPATGGFARTARSLILTDFPDTRGVSGSSE